MRPVTVSQTGVGTTDPVRLDSRQQSFSVGVGVVVDGTVTYTVQHTYDNPRDYTDAADYNTNATWFDAGDTDLVGATTNQNGYYDSPVEASRVNVTAGAGSVTATYLQGSKS